MANRIERSYADGPASLYPDAAEARPLNTSGLHPTGLAVLVRPYDPPKADSKIVLPDFVKERTLMVETRAVVIELGTDVGSEERARAQPGDLVLISKFAGVMAVGVKDGQHYRLVNNRDIFCRIEE